MSEKIEVKDGKVEVTPETPPTVYDVAVVLEKIANLEKEMTARIKIVTDELQPDLDKFNAYKAALEAAGVILPAVDEEII